MWWADLEPVRGREQGKDRPVVVVSSQFHLALTGGALVTVLPLTTVEREGWLHRTTLAAGGWVVTEQIRTVSADRFRRPALEISLTEAELAELRRVLALMLI
ncbi:MAG: type II toxin-antitoxin system PemK/MazF family toxin [Sporichthyaceae bacterium]